MRVGSPYPWPLNVSQECGAPGGGLLDIIAGEGLATPVVALDFSLVASGNATNLGSDGGTFDAVGTPTYGNAFPATIGGTAVGFDTITADAFAASSNSIGDIGTNWTLMVVLSASATSATTNIVAKRDTGFGAGFEMRSSGTGLPTCLVENTSGTVDSIQLSTSVIDGNDNYVTMGVDGGTTLFCSSNLDSEQTDATLTGSYASTSVMRLGLDQRDAFGSGGGLVRYLIVWDQAYREASISSLWTALGGS